MCVIRTDWNGGAIVGMDAVVGAIDGTYRPWKLGRLVEGIGGGGMEGPVGCRAADGRAPWRNGREGAPSPRVGYDAVAVVLAADGGRLSTSARREEI